MDDAARLLLISIEARLERSEHEVGHAAVEWLEVCTAPAAPAELREGFRVRAYGEIWRRERLRHLAAEVRAGTFPVQDRTLYFVALDACDPRHIPSFREWMAERAPAGEPATLGR